MTTIQSRQIQLIKMHIKKIKKVLSVLSNIFSHHIAHTFLPHFLISPHFNTHIYPTHYTPLSPLRYTALHYTSLHFTSLQFLHFYMIFTSLLLLHFSITFNTIYISLTHLNNRFSYPLSQGLYFTGESS